MSNVKGRKKTTGKGGKFDADDYLIFGDDYLIFGKTKKRHNTKWDESFIGIVRTLASEGFINEEIAEKIGVDVSTFYLWQKEKSGFLDAVKVGKEFANARVARALYQRALGFTYESEEIKVVSDGMQMGSSIERVPVTKYVPPDVTAQKFFLVNRDAAQWKERVETTTIHEGTITVGYDGGDDE